MPVYHFTFHAYRSWNTDHPEGWLQHGDPERKRPTPDLAKHRDELSKYPPVLFTAEQQKSILHHIHDISSRRAWRPYAISADATHLHIVIAWDDQLPMEKIRDTLKRLTGYLLAQDAGTQGKPWFSHGADEQPVHNKKYLHHLLYEYLPKHHGHFWRRELT